MLTRPDATVSSRVISTRKVRYAMPSVRSRADNELVDREDLLAAGFEPFIAATCNFATANLQNVLDRSLQSSAIASSDLDVQDRLIRCARVDLVSDPLHRVSFGVPDLQAIGAAAVPVRINYS